MVSFDIHPLLTHIHTVFLIVLVSTVKYGRVDLLATPSSVKVAR